jgi:hypothetical protein
VTAVARKRNRASKASGAAAAPAAAAAATPAAASTPASAPADAATRETGWLDRLTDSPTAGWWIAFGLFAIALALRIVNLGVMNYYITDQLWMIPNAWNYVHAGLLAPDNWYTQPGIHVLSYLSVVLFGNDAIGWYARTALTGAGTVVFAYLISRHLSKNLFPAIAAAVLLALDSASVSFAGQPTQDIPVALLILGMVLFWLRAMEHDRWYDWLVAGLFAGVGLAIRIYVVIPLAVLVVLAIALRWRDQGTDAPSRAENAIAVAAYLVAVPLACYVAVYLPWAARGYTVGDWVAMQIDAIRFQTGGLGPEVKGLAGAWRWFIQWVAVGVPGPYPRSYSVTANDPFVWIFFVPSALYMGWRGLRGRNAGYLAVAGSFLLLYAFFALSSRPINLYSALPVVPLGFIALGWAADALLKRWAWVFLGVAVAWSAFLYPLAAGLPVISAPYVWLIHLVGIA